MPIFVLVKDVEEVFLEEEKKTELDFKESRTCGCGWGDTGANLIFSNVIL